MALLFADGVPSKEAIWYWTSGHRSAAQATLNDWAGTTARVIFDDVGGISGRGDFEDQRSTRLGRSGELLHPAYESGRTITPSGRIQAKLGSPRAVYLRRAEAVLNAAFEERTLEGVMKIWLPGADRESDAFWSFAARVLAFDVDDNQQNDQHDAWPFQRGFTLGLRCSDPRIYFSEAINGGPNATTVTVTNPGRDVNPLVFCEVDGTSDLTIFNDSIGRKLKVDTSTLGATKVISFNFDQRIIWASDIGDTPFVDGADITRLLLTADSTWWDPGVYGIDRGANTLRQTGGSNITVSFYPCV